jgi:hypothetical protein
LPPTSGEKKKEFRNHVADCGNSVFPRRKLLQFVHV